MHTQLLCNRPTVVSASPIGQTVGVCSLHNTSCQTRKLLGNIIAPSNHYSCPYPKTVLTLLFWLYKAGLWKSCTERHLMTSFPHKTEKASGINMQATFWSTHWCECFPLTYVGQIQFCNCFTPLQNWIEYMKHENLYGKSHLWCCLAWFKINLKNRHISSLRVSSKFTLGLRTEG